MFMPAAAEDLNVKYETHLLTALEEGRGRKKEKDNSYKCVTFKVVNE